MAKRNVCVDPVGHAGVVGSRNFVTCALSVRERAIVDRLKTLAAVADDADLVRIALWRLVRHYDLDAAPDYFVLGRGK